MNGETSPEPYQVWLVGVIALAVLLLWVSHIKFVVFWDKRRISRYITSRGGMMVSVRYAFFGLGWLAHKSTRAYTVVYVDEHGMRKRATCRTAWLAGVYFTEEKAAGHGERAR